MYNVFPYHETQVPQLKRELDTYKARDYREAFKKNKETLISVIGSMTNNSYLKSEIFDFIDKVINKDTASLGMDLQNNAGAQIEGFIDNLYTEPYEATEEEISILESAVEDFDDVDTEVVTDDEIAQITKEAPDSNAKTLIRITAPEKASVQAKLKGSEELLETDSQTYAMQKVILLRNFNDALRLNKTANTKAVSSRTQINHGNQDWNVYADSFVGSHTQGVNSDSYTVGKDDSLMLGALADGVTTVIGESGRSNPNDFVGHYFAKTLSKAIADFDMKAFQGSTSEFPPSELNQEETDLKISILYNPSKFLSDMTKLEGFSFNKDLKIGFLDQLIKHFETNQPKSPIINLLKDKETRLALSSFAPFYFAKELVEKELSSNYPNREKAVEFASTINYAFDYEDQVITVKMGDSQLAAYNSKGKLLEADHKLSLGEFRSTRVELPLYANYFLESSEDLASQLDDNNNIEISSFNRASLNHLVIACDGITGRDELPTELPRKADQVIPHLAKQLIIKRPELDDATIMVIEKAS